MTAQGLQHWSDHRFEGIVGGRLEDDEAWDAPFQWEKQARQEGKRRRVEILGDLFAGDFSLGSFADLLGVIESTPNLDWVLTTVNPAQVEDALRLVVKAAQSKKQNWNAGQWANLWLGVKVSRQDEADILIPQLLQAPVARRVAFVEGMQEEIDLPGMVFYGTESSGGIIPLKHKGLSQLDWVVLAGGVGSVARPMHPNWVRSIQEQCEIAEVPFFFCGWGEWVPRGPESMGYPVIDGVERIRITDLGQNDQDLSSEGDEPVWVQRAGPERGGRMLDGNEWSQVPFIG